MQGNWQKPTSGVMSMSTSMTRLAPIEPSQPLPRQYSLPGSQSPRPPVSVVVVSVPVSDIG